jgi:hypothetical protein
MSDVLLNKIVKTRKEHSCWGCKRKFPKGTMMNLIKNAGEGIVFNSYWCEICDKYLQDNPDILMEGDGICEGDLLNEEDLVKLIEEDKNDSIL